MTCQTNGRNPCRGATSHRICPVGCDHPDALKFKKLDKQMEKVKEKIGKPDQS
jgi:hypothetical protein